MAIATADVQIEELTIVAGYVTVVQGDINALSILGFSDTLKYQRVLTSINCQ